MGVISRARVKSFLLAGDIASTSFARGRALEDLICYVFEKVPGITVTKRNALNVSGSEEIDVAFWNDRHPKGLYFFPYILLVECKNTGEPVSTQDLVHFDSKLRNRARTVGILVAAHGITGVSSPATASHTVLSNALRDGREIVVVTREELEDLSNTTELVRLIQEKLCELTVTGSAV